MAIKKNIEISETEVKKLIEKTNQDLAAIEKIKKYHVIKEEFTVENELLTPTMKIRRYKIKSKYKNILENFYKN